jgi:hypothetical protein
MRKDKVRRAGFEILPVKKDSVGSHAVNIIPAEDVRYRIRTGVERVFSHLHDSHGGKTIRVRGNKKSVPAPDVRRACHCGRTDNQTSSLAAHRKTGCCGWFCANRQVCFAKKQLWKVKSLRKWLILYQNTERAVRL